MENMLANYANKFEITIGERSSGYTEVVIDFYQQTPKADRDIENGNQGPSVADTILIDKMVMPIDIAKQFQELLNEAISQYTKRHTGADGEVKL